MKHETVNCKQIIERCETLKIIAKGHNKDKQYENLDIVIMHAKNEFKLTPNILNHKIMKTITAVLILLIIGCTKDEQVKPYTFTSVKNGNKIEIVFNQPSKSKWTITVAATEEDAKAYDKTSKYEITYSGYNLGCSGLSMTYQWWTQYFHIEADGIDQTITYQ